MDGTTSKPVADTQFTASLVTKEEQLKRFMLQTETGRRHHADVGTPEKKADRLHTEHGVPARFVAQHECSQLTSHTPWHDHPNNAAKPIPSCRTNQAPIYGCLSQATNCHGAHNQIFIFICVTARCPGLPININYNTALCCCLHSFITSPLLNTVSKDNSSR